MNVINIDAYQFFHLWMDKNLEDASKKKLELIEYVLDVVQPIERMYYQRTASEYLHFLHPIIDAKIPLPIVPTWRLESFGYENVALYLHTIPIYLREEKPSIKPDDNCIIDLLGAYYPSRNGNSPYVELYMKTIEQESKGNCEHFIWLYTIVLLHELAHAALDVYNISHDLRNIRYGNLYSTEFGRWWEESKANAIALKIIKEFGDVNFYSYAKVFMKSQPAEYALGVLMEDFTSDEFGNVITAKLQGVTSFRQSEWLKYAKNNPNTEGLKDWEHLFFCHYVHFFDNNWYSNANELVPAVVNKVLSDYQKTHNTLMPYDEFSALFPNCDDRGNVFYKNAEEVEGENVYIIPIKLNDGVYYLSKNWSIDTQNTFISKPKTTGLFPIIEDKM